MAVKRSGNLAGKLNRLTDEMRKQIRPAVYTVADVVQKDAQVSITTGSAGGDSGGKHQHTPSAPGTPPNSHTGALAGSIEVEEVDDLTAQVVVHSPYGAIQEFGGTIAHPGGTAYFIGSDGLAKFVSNRTAARFASLHGRELLRTKPHNITLPERPYLRPAAQKNKESGRKLIRAAIDKVVSGGNLG